MLLVGRLGLLRLCDFWGLGLTSATVSDKVSDVGEVPR
jgi:hypothetical protein